MNKMKTLLIVIALLSISSVTFASNLTGAAVPLPVIGILFASALFAAGALGRRKKKSKRTLMVGAFTRVS